MGRLRVVLRGTDETMPVTGSWIAATPISLGVPDVTQHEDYVEVAGLEVIGV